MFKFILNNLEENQRGAVQNTKKNQQDAKVEYKSKRITFALENLKYNEYSRQLFYTCSNDETALKHCD